MQRVSSARVTVGEDESGRIGRGLLVFVGVGRDDGPQDLDYIVAKIQHLRVFDDAAPPEQARPMYAQLVERLRADGLTVETGRFQAMMAVEIVNDGPVTLWLDSADR